MDNRDTYEASGDGPAVGFGGTGGNDAAPQTGNPTPMDQGFEEERQRRQEDWSPGAQTGFDNADVERHDAIYTDGEESDREEADRESVDE